MIKKLAWVAIIGMLLAFTTNDKKRVRIFLAGDSTMANKSAKAFPEHGWGMPFTSFWDSTVEVVNEAQNGRSTSSFLKEGRWKKITDRLEPGDYVFIQFGHNDEVITKKTYTIPDSFTLILKKYIADTRAMGATPVLFTPVSRRLFDEWGTQQETHKAYSELVRQVARETNAAFIDLDRESITLYQSMGASGSRMLFLQLKPGEHPNYPQGKEDNTHFNELGARLIAQLVLSKLQPFNFDLNNRLVKR